MHEVGLYGCVASKKPYVNKVNQRKSFKYAKTPRENPLDFWNKMLWSDESTFNRFGSDEKIIVWYSLKEEFEFECTIPTVKHGTCNVKCLGCFSSSGVSILVFIDGNMTGKSYGKILENNMLKSVEKLGMSHDWIFQHDNDPKHRATIVAK